MTDSVWKLSAARRSTNWKGRVFATFVGVHRVTGVERSVTVIVRHDRGDVLVTGREARQLAVDALDARGHEVIHQTIDPDQEVLTFRYY